MKLFVRDWWSLDQSEKNRSFWNVCCCSDQQFSRFIHKLLRVKWQPGKVWQSDFLSNNMYIKCMYSVVNCHLESDWYAYPELERISRRIAVFLFYKGHNQSNKDCGSTFYIQWQWQNLLLSINLFYLRHVVRVRTFSSFCLSDYRFWYDILLF